MSIDPKYWTEATATGGGRNGTSKLADGKLTVTMTSPKELGGSGAGHNPEELFALGYAAPTASTCKPWQSGPPCVNCSFGLREFRFWW